MTTGTENSPPTTEKVRLRPPTSGSYKPGQTGNPKGRAVGSRNKATLMAYALMEQGGGEIVEKVMEAAKGGDMQACRIVIDRLVPPAKEKPISIKLPELTNLAACADAHSQVAAAVAEGDLLPGEGQALASLIDGQRKHYEAAMLEERVAALEEALRGRTIEGERS